ncbi:hypothetical protein [Amycolatopsis pretoriensis]|uniref:hypothetical protein n=1 Tax=Amycolatopsis pretoriensis TaxID=218821 RepID=UPI00115FC377|nr:hypothetical protein [Amycolatopsis pretoriensis]
MLAIDHKTRTADVAVSIEIGDHAEPVSGPDGRTVPVEEVNGNYTLMADYRAVAEVRPKELAATDGRGVTVGYNATVKLPLTAASQRFPDDQYSLHQAFDLLLPDGYTLSGTKNKSLSLAVLPLRNEALTDWRTVVRNTSPTWYVELLLERSSNVRKFVYGVAIAPLVLGLAAMVIWLRRRDRVPFELAAAILALLPLRSVLVPNDVPGITRLDTVLGIELVFIATAVTLMAVVSVFARSSEGVGRHR